MSEPINTIDENSRQVGLGYAPDIDFTVQPLVTDYAPAGYPIILPAMQSFPPDNYWLLVEIIPVTPQGVLVSEHILIDENSRQIGAAVLDNSAETIQALSVDMVQNISCLRVDVEALN